MEIYSPLKPLRLSVTEDHDCILANDFIAFSLLLNNDRGSIDSNSYSTFASYVTYLCDDINKLNN